MPSPSSDSTAHNLPRDLPTLLHRSLDLSEFPPHYSTSSVRRLPRLDHHRRLHQPLHRLRPTISAFTFRPFLSTFLNSVGAPPLSVAVANIVGHLRPSAVTPPHPSVDQRDTVGLAHISFGYHPNLFSYLDSSTWKAAATTNPTHISAFVSLPSSSPLPYLSAVATPRSPSLLRPAPALRTGFDLRRLPTPLHLLDDSPNPTPRRLVLRS